jgi:hypothetical protein
MELIELASIMVERACSLGKSSLNIHCLQEKFNFDGNLQYKDIFKINQTSV